MVILLTLLVGVGNVNAQVTGINIGVQSVSVAYGQSGTVTFTISFTRSGNGTSISGLSVISGLPSGVSASWSATFSTASGNHDPSPVTLTINTLPTIPVGSYQFTVSSTSPVLSSNGTLTVDKATPILSVTNTPQNYTGTPIAASVAGTGGGVVSNLKYNGSATVPTDAGTYAITADIAASTNYTAATGASAGDFVISPIAPTLSVGNTPQNYTGSPIAAIVSGIGGGTVSNIKYNGSTMAPTDAGTYAITADIAASTNYTAAIGASAGNFVIGKATPTISVSGAQTFTYNVSSQGPSTIFYNGDGTPSLLYTNTSGTAYSSSTAPTNAGSYQVVASATAGTNYNAVSSGAYTFTINKATPTISVSGAQTFTYNGSSQGPSTIFYNGDGTPSLLYTNTSGTAYLSSTAPTNAGSYQVVASGTAGTNYNAVSSGAYTFTINKATPTATLAVSNSPVTYDGTAKSATVAISASSVSGSVSNVLTGGAVNQTNAGTYAVTADFVPDGANYNTLTGLSAGNFTIGKATPVVTPTVGTYTYTGTPQGPNSATNTGTGSSYTFSYVGVSGTTYASSATPPTNAGNYNVTATVAASVDGNYDSASSAAISFTIDKANQTITWANPASITYGTLLSATQLNAIVAGVSGGSAAGALTYTPTSGTLLNAGSQTLQVDAAATTNYNVATKTVTLVVDKAVLTVTADNQTKVFGAANPSLTFVYSGWVNGVEPIDVAPTASTTVTGNTAVGTYNGSITLSGGSDNNYIFSYVAGNLKVNPATLTVMASAQSKVYGAIAPTTGTLNTNFTVTGLLNGDVVNGATLGYSGSPSGDLATAAIGSYTITPSGVTFSTGVATNYSIAYSTGTLTVTPATLTVTAINKTVTYGDATPSLTYTISGFLNGDTESTAVNGLPALATTYTNTTQVSSSPVAITAAIGTLSSSNYSFAFAGGTLSITKKALTITASTRSKCFGDADSFSGNEFTSSGLINGDVINSVTLSSGGTAANAAAGTYSIVPSNALGSGLENYQINYTNGIFTVNPIPAIGSFN